MKIFKNLVNNLLYYKIKKQLDKMYDSDLIMEYLNNLKKEEAIKLYYQLKKKDLIEILEKNNLGLIIFSYEELMDILKTNIKIYQYRDILSVMLSNYCYAQEIIYTLELTDEILETDNCPKWTKDAIFNLVHKRTQAELITLLKTYKTHKDEDKDHTLKNLIFNKIMINNYTGKEQLSIINMYLENNKNIYIFAIALNKYTVNYKYGSVKVDIIKYFTKTDCDEDVLNILMNGNNMRHYALSELIELCKLYISLGKPSSVKGIIIDLAESSLPLEVKKKIICKYKDDYDAFHDIFVTCDGLFHNYRDIEEEFKLIDDYPYSQPLYGLMSELNKQISPEENRIFLNRFIEMGQNDNLKILFANTTVRKNRTQDEIFKMAHELEKNEYNDEVLKLLLNEFFLENTTYREQTLFINTLKKCNYDYELFNRICLKHLAQFYKGETCQIELQKDKLCHNLRFKPIEKVQKIN